MTRWTVGSLVRCREREWVVLPSEQAEVLHLRPVGGGETERCGIYLPLEGHLVQAATFAPPPSDQAGDMIAGQLLRDAARLSLRSGAGPFRSLGRLGVRPRPYQLVPLIMALRLDTVRLLIADDVGVGKTIEAGLIIRELLDRGEARRLAVICPPHLCDQWQRELAEKFALDAPIIRASTIAALERQLPPDRSVFEYYPHLIISIDYAKSARRKDAFVQHCPDLVVVDEAHTAAQPGGHSSAQQQRHELLQQLAARRERHVLLLTATPHSGIEDAFRSLLALLQPAFAQYDMLHLTPEQRAELARFFVQRRRADVSIWLGEETPFPERRSKEITYRLDRSPQYRKLFADVYAFARELVRDEPDPTQQRSAWRSRVRFWAALALLRCVMSSPAAAETALRRRAEAHPDDPTQLEDRDVDADVYTDTIYDRTEQEATHDLEPVSALQAGTPRSERARTLRFAEQARALRGNNDPKLLTVVAEVAALLKDGFQPIVYCRYIATAEYVAEELQRRLGGRDTTLRVTAVTGNRTDDERTLLVAELSASPRRVLVATDCLSEGINLQHAFNAVIHYDLPWNPNRLEQREGRVDRYGQAAPQVRTALVYGEDNPIDATMMRVLRRKAVAIHSSLGISMPLPMDSASMVDTLIGSLFSQPHQPSLFDLVDLPTTSEADTLIDRIDQAWEQAEQRERRSRTLFAQHRIKPEEVARELQESDAVLGDAATVERFVREACQRLNASLQPGRSRAAHQPIYRLALEMLPEPVRDHVAPTHGDTPPDMMLTFVEPAPEGVQFVGRNHPLTAGLAHYLLETALLADADSPVAARSGALRSSDVQRRTTLVLLRVRMLIERSYQAEPSLAEELVVCGYTGTPHRISWLDPEQAVRLLETVRPTVNMMSRAERTHAVATALEQIAQLDSAFDDLAQARAVALHESHTRVRRATGGARVTVRPHLPPDVLGVYVVLPEV